MEANALSFKNLYFSKPPHLQEQLFLCIYIVTVVLEK